MKQQQGEYYSKFLTSITSNNNQQKLPKSSTQEFNRSQKQIISNQADNKEVNEDYIPFSTNNKNSPQKDSSDLSQITYGLFVNQTKERLFQTFFKNQQDSLATKNKKKSKSPKLNQLKATKTKEIRQSKIREAKANTEKKKKEFYEDIIKANRECIRFNPFLELEIENERKFEIENLNTDKVIEIEIENEVESKRQQAEQAHKEILVSRIPEIFARIKVSEKDKYFIKNKYQEALASFEE